MAPLTVTVVIPCYNAASTLEETLQAILAQSHPPAQVVIADDCSTDNTAEVASRYPVTVVRNQSSLGCGGSRNAAAAVATGDLIACCDADDVWESDHLARLVALLDQHPHAGVAFAPIFRKRAGELVPTEPPKWPDSEPFNPHPMLLHYNFITPSTVVMRRAIWEQLGGCDPNYRSAEDYDMWLRASRVTMFIGHHVPTVMYRLHAGQMSKDFQPLVSHIWRARLRELTIADQEGRLEDRKVLEASWLRALQASFSTRSRTALRTVLSHAPAFPRLAPRAAKWRRIERLWPLLHPILRLWDGLPPGVRRQLRGSTPPTFPAQL